MSTKPKSRTAAARKAPAKVRPKRATKVSARRSAKVAAPPARAATKQSALIGRLSRKSGATIAELQTVTGWQAHSVRGALSGTLRKKLGLAVTSEKVEGRGRVYRIAQGG